MGDRLAASFCALSLPSWSTTAVNLDLEAFPSAQAGMVVPAGKASSG